jgi:Cu2+-exporting ATPase
LGRSSWALRTADGGSDSGSVTQSILTVDGSFRAAFGFEDELRPDAASTISRLQDRGLSLEILSGDRVAVVSRLAKLLGISVFRAGILPADKQSRVKVLENEGHRVLMVGDGINDAPALAAAYVSMAPASAADVGRSASDFVFMHKSLGAVVLTRDMSVRAGRLIRQNFGLAIAYNLVAVPCAVLGFASPLVAAIAMSSSSILVVLNSLRLRIGSNGPAEPISPAVGAVRDNRPFAATEIGV